MNKCAARLVSLLSWCVPKRPATVAFYPKFKDRRHFSGNLKYLFLHMSAQDGVEVIWVTHSHDLATDLRSKGYRATSHYVDRWLTLLRASLIAIESDELTLRRGQFRFIQCWHGTGFKNIVLLDPNLQSPRTQKKRYAHARQIALTIATSEEDRQRKAKSISAKSTLVTGSPRNDVFFSSHESPEQIRASLGLPASKRIFLYVPTFRDHSAPIVFSENFWNRLDTLLEESGSLFVFKRHHRDKKLHIPTRPNVIDVTGRCEDVQRLLMVSDVLISDYSGISTDFALLRRPMLFFIYDYERYIRNDRSFWYDLKATLPGPFPATEEELLAFMGDMSWHNQQPWVDRYEGFVRRFHSFQDGGSSERVAREVGKILKNG